MQFGHVFWLGSIDGCTVGEMNKDERGLEPTGTEVIFGSEDWDFFFKFPFSIAYADVFPIVASLPSENNNISNGFYS